MDTVIEIEIITEQISYKIKNTHMYIHKYKLLSLL